MTNFMYDEEIFPAVSPDAAVEWLRKGAFDPKESVEDFMADMASRVTEEKDSEIRSDTAENFINDLVACGALIKHES